MTDLKHNPHGEVSFCVTKSLEPCHDKNPSRLALLAPQDEGSACHD
jgi:hypothetical protein